MRSNQRWRLAIVNPADHHDHNNLNAQGLEGSQAFHNISRLVAETTLDLLFVSETKISQFHVDLLCTRLKF